MGKVINAKITGVSRVQVKINNLPYYVIQGQWFDSSTNVMHLIESEFIPYDPTEFIANRKDIILYVNPNNPEEYWVDISFLPQAIH